MTSPPVAVIRKSKRSHDGVGTWPAYVMAEDRCGRWLYSPKGTTYRGSSGSVTSKCEVGQGHRDSGLAVMHLVPMSGWWIATWTRDGADSWIAVDICTPPSLVNGAWSYVDLELDPHAFADGRVEILDRDEFADARQRGLISPVEASEAMAAAIKVEDMLRSQVEPFGRVGWEQLAAALESGLPPITIFEST